MTIRGEQPARGRPTTLVGADRRTRVLWLLLVSGLLALALSTLYLALLLSILPGLGIASRNLAHALATLAVALAVVPLRRGLERLLKRIFHRDWPDAQALIRETTAALSRTIDPNAIRPLLVDQLPARLGLSGATLWMLEPPDDRMFVALGLDPAAPGAQLMERGDAALLLRSAPRYAEVLPGSPEPWAEPFLDRAVHLIFPLRINERLIGIYGCGMPLTGGRYPLPVVELLLTIMPAAAGAIENARAYTLIARLNEQLRALDRLKDEFIESIAHELRTPLTSLSLATQLLANNPELVHELMGVLHENVTRLQVLIDRSLSLNLVQPQEATGTAAIELLPLLGDVMATFAPIVERNGHQIVLDAPAELAAWADGGRLRRAIHEIVDNAIRYGGRGTVSITVIVREGMVVVSVSDQGSGIPPDERPLLFDAFYRGSQTRSLATTPGVGLGLSIARREIEVLGGRVWLERSGPGGTTISLALPAVPQETDGQERAVGE